MQDSRTELQQQKQSLVIKRYLASPYILKFTETYRTDAAIKCETNKKACKLAINQSCPIKNQERNKMISEEESHSQIAQLIISDQHIRFGKITIKVTLAIFQSESYQIDAKYQLNIHKQQSVPYSYKQFLCSQTIYFRQQYSPLKGLYSPTWNIQNRWQRPYEVEEKAAKMVGCFHMKYYYQDRLIAVGVIGILDHGMVSNYFFYDTDFKKCRLGVLSALIEIEYIRYLNIKFPEFKYYFIGTQLRIVTFAER